MGGPLICPPTFEAVRHSRYNRGMSDERRKGNRWHPALVPSAILCLVLAVYVGGYFASLIDEHDARLSKPVANLRVYRSRTAAYVYAPLAWIDAKINRHKVRVMSPDGVAVFNP